MGERSAPHHGVYTRLRPSALHGVGVFAICDIPAGTNLFSTDEADMQEISAAEFQRMDDPERRDLYDAFCVREGEKLYGPESFNKLTVAWYLNNSDTPNVECDAFFNFRTKRDIVHGEELTVTYATYSSADVSSRAEPRSDGDLSGNGSGRSI